MRRRRPAGIYKRAEISGPRFWPSDLADAVGIFPMDGPDLRSVPVWAFEWGEAGRSTWLIACRPIGISGTDIRRRTAQMRLWRPNGGQRGRHGIVWTCSRFRHHSVLKDHESYLNGEYKLNSFAVKQINSMVDNLSMTIICEICATSSV